MNRRFEVINGSIYDSLIFEAVKVNEDFIILNTFDGDKEFKVNEVREVYKKEFCILNNKNNKLKKTMFAFDREDVSKKYKGVKNIRVITKQKYIKEQNCIEDQLKKKEELFKKGVEVRALDIVKK